MPQDSRRRALVVGASIAGLLAARVLAEHYAEVTLIEKDELPDGPAHRRHVPQSLHYHALLASGLEAMTRLFPGFAGELIAAGARQGDAGSGIWRVVAGHRHDRTPLGKASMAASRILIEHLIRQRVRSIANVRFLSGSEALRPLPGTDGRSVAGLRVRAGGAERNIHADLVVDCSGRGSRVPAWLDSLGFLPPRCEELRIDARYRTRSFHFKPGRMDGLRALFVTTVPGNPRYGVVGYQEGEVWMCSIGGLGGVQAPAELEGFLDFARSLPVPDLYEALRDAEPVGEARAYGMPSNLRRRYERLRAFPRGLLVMGDAVCSFNPTYGQGMTVAAMEALALRDWLRRPDANAKTWFRSIAPIVDRPWFIVTGGDALTLGLPAATRGAKGWINRYLARFHAAAAYDAALSHAFLRVANLEAAPASLLRPALAWRVWRHGKRSPRVASAVPAETVSIAAES
jgi:2-polyprenyl-6-methoxyphenol hydroxylase-like FAD-dependent oxidoreductase